MFHVHLAHPRQNVLRNFARHFSKALNVAPLFSAKSKFYSEWWEVHFSSPFHIKKAFSCFWKTITGGFHEAASLSKQKSRIPSLLVTQMFWIKFNFNKFCNSLAKPPFVFSHSHNFPTHSFMESSAFSSAFQISKSLEYVRELSLVPNRSSFCLCFHIRF